jgi:hypothetical protein
MVRWKSVGAVAAACTVTVSLFGVVPASADTTDGTVAAVAAATPETVAAAAQVAMKSSGENAIDATVAGVEVTVPVDAANGITVAGENGSVSIGLPFADRAADATTEQAGVVSYDNNNGSTTVPVVQKDGSVQINTVIQEREAPQRYAYPMSVSNGGKLQLAPDGSAFVEDVTGTPVAFIAAPWAKDSKGKDVPTHYEVAGATLTQVVEHGQSDSYPVVADPWLGIQLIDGASWVTRDSRGRTLVVTPSWFNRINAADGNVIREGWNEVIRRQPSANTTQMYWQYKCHQVAAPFKSTWNLDVWVKRNNYTDSVAHACN